MSDPSIASARPGRWLGSDGTTNVSASPSAIELAEAFEWDRVVTHVVTYQSDAGVEATLEQSYARSGAYTALLETERKLGTIARLERNWDSYGSLPPATAAIETAQSFLEVFTRQYAPYLGRRIAPDIVTPIAGGGIQMDWWGKSIEVELDIDASGSIGYLLVNKDVMPTFYVERDDVSLPDAVDIVARSIVM